jgi:hypothetical protein
MTKESAISLQKIDCNEDDYNPFAAKNQKWTKAILQNECNVKYHNFGIRKYGFCANCNGTIFF